MSFYIFATNEDTESGFNGFPFPTFKLTPEQLAVWPPTMRQQLLGPMTRKQAVDLYWRPKRIIISNFVPVPIDPTYWKYQWITNYDDAMSNGNYHGTEGDFVPQYLFVDLMAPEVATPADTEFAVNGDERDLSTNTSLDFLMPNTDFGAFTMEGSLSLFNCGSAIGRYGEFANFDVYIAQTGDDSFYVPYDFNVDANGFSGLSPTPVLNFNDPTEYVGEDTAYSFYGTLEDAVTTLPQPRSPSEATDYADSGELEISILGETWTAKGVNAVGPVNQTFHITVSEYFEWDPKDNYPGVSDGPVYNKNTGEQLRDPVQVSQELKLIHTPS